MNVINLADRRPKQQLRSDVADLYAQAVAYQFEQEGRELADLAAPIIEPFRQCEPDLERHLKGAFLRWQMAEIRRELDGEPNRHIAIGVAIQTTIQAFTDRLVELQEGFDPNDGGFAA